jgi:hypothetical protein
VTDVEMPKFMTFSTIPRGERGELQLSCETLLNRSGSQRIVNVHGRDIESTMCAATVQQPE